MADDCAALGFEMDCGHAFECAYDKAVYDSTELDRIIDDITDIRLPNNIGYGPCPEPGDEVEQYLTINMDERVWFSAYAFGNRSGKYIKARGNNFSIGKSSAKELLNKIASCISEEYDELFAKNGLPDDNLPEPE